MNIFSLMILVDASEWIKIAVSNKVYFNFQSFKNICGTFIQIIIKAIFSHIIFLRIKD